MKANQNFKFTENNQAEVALKESEENMRYIIKHDPNAIAIYDFNLHYIAVSDRYLSDYNVREEDIIGKHHYEVFPEMPQKWKDVHQRCLAGAIESNDDDSFERPDGSITYNRWECRPWLKINGEIGGIITYTEVTTERKKAEKALFESEIKYHAFFESSMDAILLTTSDGKTLAANPAACSMFGYSEEELIKLGKFGVEDASDPRLTVLLAERKVKGKVHGEVTLIRKDGTHFPAEISSSVFKNNEGLERTSMIIREISARKREEETLLKLSSAVEQTVDTIVITDRNGIIEYINPAFEVLTGYSFEEAMGKTPRIVKSGIENQSYYDEMWKTILAGHVFRAEIVNKKKNGDLFFEQKTISPIFDQNKNITHFVGTGADISERKRTEEALQESEKLYRSLFENMLNGFAYCKMIFEGDCPQDFIYLAVNNSFEILTGLKDVIGKKVTEVIPGIRKSDPALFEIYGRVALTGKPETIEIYVEALKMWFSISIYSPIKEHFVAVFDVITSRKNAEEVLRQSEAKFRKLINTLPDPVLVIDSQGRIVYCNENVMRNFDYNMDEMLSLTLEDLIPNHIREHHLAFRNKYNSEPVSRPMGKGKERFAKRKDGSEFPTEIMLEPVEINNNQFILAIVRDVTERMRNEKELILAKNKAEESDRLKSAFLANMSHEVRTPLNSIIGFSELLADPFFEDQKNEFIQSIIISGNNLLTVISDIMDFSKMESGEIAIRRSQINALKFILIIKEQFAIQIEGKKLEFKLTHPDNEEDTVIFADTERLRQIFNNLLSNAIKFTENGSIEIGYQPKGKMVEFYVKDTGIGIPAEFHNTIFERFRQVEAENTRKYGGNGLGLAISKNLVELMGGKIWLESEDGKGSVFYFSIPRDGILQEKQ